MTTDDRKSHNELYDKLCASLAHAIATPNENINIKKSLTEQAQVLDMAFHQIMSKSLISYEPSECYREAFKAQNQYRRTVEILQKLEKLSQNEKTN